MGPDLPKLHWENDNQPHDQRNPAAQNLSFARDSSATWRRIFQDMHPRLSAAWTNRETHTWLISAIQPRVLFAHHNHHVTGYGTSFPLTLLWWVIRLLSGPITHFGSESWWIFFLFGGGLRFVTWPTGPSPSLSNEALRVFVFDLFLTGYWRLSMRNSIIGQICSLRFPMTHSRCLLPKLSLLVPFVFDLIEKVNSTWPRQLPLSRY